MTEGTTMPAEREAIVRWLREKVEVALHLAKSDGASPDYKTAQLCLAGGFAAVADAISRCDHLKESTHE